MAAVALTAACCLSFALQTPAQGGAAADSAAVLRALIVSNGGAAAEARATRWLASIPASAAFDTARCLAQDVLVEAMVGAGHWTDSTSHAAAARAIRANTKLYGPDAPAVGRSLITEARMLYRAGEFDSARVSAERGLALVEKAYGEQHKDVIRGIHYLANILEEQSDFAAAERLYRREIALAAQVLGEKSVGLANSLNSLAILYRKTGRLSEARELYERAISMREAALGPDHPDLAGPLNNLGNVFTELGDYRDARRMYERGLGICSQHFPPDHPLVGQLLGNLANAEAGGGDTSLALDHYAQALAIRDRPGAGSNADAAFVLDDQGAVLIAHGDFVAARIAVTRALAIRQRAYAPDNPSIAQSLEVMGDLEMAVGNAPAASRNYAQALEIREQSLGAWHPDVARSLADLARSQFATGDPGAALTNALRAESVASAHFRLTARTQEERVALAYAATRPSGLDLAISLALESGADSVATAAWDALIRSRAQVLDEMASRRRSVVSSGDSTTLALADSLRTSNTQLSWLLAAGTGGARLESAARERERIEEILANRSAEFRHAESARASGWAEVERALGEQTTLVSFVRFQRWTRTVTGPMYRTFTVPAYAAFVMRGGGGTRSSLISLGPAEAIDSCVSSWVREVARRPAMLARDRSEARVRALGSQLRQRVWDPLDHAIGVANAVWLVPDGSLQLVNFAALPSRGGGYLAESAATLELLSAERDLVAGVDATLVGRGMLAVGAPDFDHAAMVRPKGAAAGCDNLAALQFDPLPATRTEVEQIARLWRSSNQGGDLDVALGREANESLLRTQAHGKSTIHLATHGFFLSGECAVRGGTGKSGAERQTIDSLTYDNPLLRSGLAFAGANRRTAESSGSDNGILTAEEIASLDLSGVDWVVLSACDTGRGEFRAGEGVLGLRRAFEVAGARHVIMSLWPVDDEATREWMRELYEAHLRRGEGAARAVQSASRAMLRMRRASGLSDHPFYWGAFVVAGTGN
jgi:CHAT domain-containing protein/tetratricopeptide (TPR) repeat protein